MGAAGAYASGSHHTGIKGVRGMAGMDPEESLTKALSIEGS